MLPGLRGRIPIMRGTGDEKAAFWSSFGFRPERGAPDALGQARGYVGDGYEIVVGQRTA